MSAGSAAALARERTIGTAAFSAAWLLKGIYGMVQAPEHLFLVALAAMLFRPPDLHVLPLDRISIALLVAVVSLRMALVRERIRFDAASWPMLALLLLGLWGVLSQPYDTNAWSVLAAKWIVPVAMFHLAGVVFASEESQRKLEWFSIAVLLYLSLTAVCFLLDLKSLIFPRFILDESIGIHAERARGPFLQAVANGVSLSILGLIALHSWERRRLGGVIAAVLFITTPLAILATKTRAVWVAAGISLMMMALFARGRRARKIAVAILILTGAGLGTALLLQTNEGDLTARALERSPVDFRIDMYRAGWQMFTEKPLLGWGNDANVQPEIAKRVTSFHPEHYIFHNTYLELSVEHGLLGVALYGWLCVCLLRLGEERNRYNMGSQNFPGGGFGLIWRIALCVYLLNASAVVMNYQFVNGYLFSIAGILAVQRQQVTTGGGNAHCLSL